MFAAAVALLLWPALLNGAPFIFADTTAYIRGADAGMYRLFGVTSDWTGIAGAPGAATAGGAGVPFAAAESQEVVLAGRSVFYGAFLYLGWAIEALWTTALLQSAVTVLAVGLAGRRVMLAAGISPSLRDATVLIVLLAAATPVAFFAVFMMPDIFAALALLAAAMLVGYWTTSTRFERSFWLACLTAGVLFHSATLLLIVTVALLVLFARIFLQRGSVSRTGLTVVSLAIVVGMAGEILFSAGVTRLTGAPPVRPPFVAARLIADGPARQVLEEDCPVAGYTLCRHLNRLNDNSDVMLWSRDPAKGIFMALPPDERRAVSTEQSSLVWRTVSDRPLAVASSTLAAMGRQVTSIELDDFNYGAAGRSPPSKAVPQPYADALNGTRASTNGMPTQIVTGLSVLTTLVGSIVLIALLLGSAKRRALPANLRVMIVTVVLGVAANAAICGALSTPHGRYQARLIWLIPLVALLAWRATNLDQRISEPAA
ncbi:hypothetical protein GGR88_000732 [Sphingomonas jejuensis]|uniref:Glycosyltransferase RgtA/B/C/D-like domain-containing protein n=1 Tax=Sphingomonas jejuensis TaxID=904715 RepID=A0ABX0XIU2_9SPHN|nr:hypothetical protein [Sphingomonas jejuensis]NJC33258.1 hypothetical protein [Sphingomonas jejuensis]